MQQASSNPAPRKRAAPQTKEPPLIIVDPKGDLDLWFHIAPESYSSTSFTSSEDEEDEIETIFTIRVSRKILVTNSMHFAEILDPNSGWKPSVTTNLDLVDSTITMVELWMRSLHEKLIPASYNVTVKYIWVAIETGRVYEFDLGILKPWFMEWLTARGRLSQLDDSTLQQLLKLAQKFDHTLGAFCIKKSLDRDNEFHTPITDYPPIMEASFRQESADIFYHRFIHSWEFKSLGFSSKFQDIFGKPTIYYTDFLRLMTTPSDEQLTPSMKSFYELDEPGKFLFFCKSVDNKVKQWFLTKSTVWRPAMEAMWTKRAVLLFRKELRYMGNYSTPLRRHRLRLRLNSILSRRLFPFEDIEAYWQLKTLAHPGEENDIVRKEDRCDEAAEEMAEEEFEDEDVMDSAVDENAASMIARSGEMETASESDGESEGLSLKDAMRRLLQLQQQP
ncbi:hypothetical protein DL98DRAFT_647619 [Cadophora sp. DSE1049]|nr:hypothetical protein DL98DRAFT_647619 [Cadophora sp. DSE1049]